ncbi:hypothetical protein L6279_02580 [Candidatus Parcubacteria bacterium]|nr:hypothetical protein [Candidatus Parcubacteria bacterium]
MKKKILIGALALGILSLAITPALAIVVNKGMNNVQTQVGWSNQDLTVTVGKIIGIVLGFLGLIALVIIVYGGFKWMTSGGEEEKIASSKKLMIAGVIGMLIILVAYAASTFIVSQLVGAV